MSDGRMDVKIMGVIVGTAKQLTDLGDYEFQAEDFKSSGQNNFVPLKAQYISFDFVNGTWAIFADNGDIESRGKVFALGSAL